MFLSYRIEDRKLRGRKGEGVGGRGCKKKASGRTQTTRRCTHGALPSALRPQGLLDAGKSDSGPQKGPKLFRVLICFLAVAFWAGQ